MLPELGPNAATDDAVELYPVPTSRRPSLFSKPDPQCHSALGRNSYNMPPPVFYSGSLNEPHAQRDGIEWKRHKRGTPKEGSASG